MANYKVVLRETYETTYIIDAESEDEARENCFDGFRFASEYMWHDVEKVTLDD